MKIIEALKQNKLHIYNDTKILQFKGNSFVVTDYSKIENNIMFTSDEDIAVNELTNAKVCKIINGKFAWIMLVDGTSTMITNPDYFRDHYKSLGYEIEEENENT